MCTCCSPGGFQAAPLLRYNFYAEFCHATHDGVNPCKSSRHATLGQLAPSPNRTPYCKRWYACRRIQLRDISGSAWISFHDVTKIPTASKLLFGFGRLPHVTWRPHVSPPISRSIHHRTCTIRPLPHVEKTKQCAHRPSPSLKTCQKSSVCQ